MLGLKPIQLLKHRFSDLGTGIGTDLMRCNLAGRASDHQNLSRLHICRTEKFLCGNPYLLAQLLSLSCRLYFF